MRRLFNINKQSRASNFKARLYNRFMNEFEFNDNKLKWDNKTAYLKKYLCIDWMEYCNKYGLYAHLMDLRNEIDTTEVLCILEKKHGVKGNDSEVFREVIYKEVMYSRARNIKISNIDIADRIFESGKYELI